MKIVLGVGGGIAAYKAAELTRALVQKGAQVQVVMTAAAQQFVQPLTFASLTGREVITDLFAPRAAIEHIAIAQENDVLAVAPATADLMAKFAHGLADDFLSTMYLAFTGRVVLAPAMNTNMWQHPATQANLETLRKRGHRIVEPGSGFLACGMVGPGRLAEPDDIAAAILANSADLAGQTVLITAGPTQEPIDPVRYISNRSSGKMGYALAEAAIDRGAKVVLVSGPVNLTPPPQVQLVAAKSALEMRDAVMQHLDAATIVIKAAAVADFRVKNEARHKMKKTGQPITLELEQNPDILAEVGRNKGSRLLIGFAAETQNLVAEARRKLEAKNCDMVVGNAVGISGTGFDADQNEVTLVLRTGEPISLPRAGKRIVADRILDEIVKLLHGR